MNRSSPSSDIEALLEDRYQVQRLLGRGGMGAVYLARDLQLDRLVAIKELPEEYARVDALRERFHREVKVAASFSHPNIVPVYAVEEHGTSLAFVMGFVEGESLAERVKRAGPLTVRETVRLLLDVTYALAYAHGRGVVHRDIKPDNIMIERATGRALLMDFGVARSIVPAPDQSGMTRVGEVVGTPEYMSPEQATGEELDGRSDLYSLGLTAYFAVTGTAPFAGDSASRILVRQLTEVLPQLQEVRPDLPAALAAAVDHCLEKDRDHRFADAAALIEALDAAQSAAPEVPLAIRLFTQEAESLGLIAFVMVVFGLLLFSSFSANAASVDRLIPLVILASILFGRIAQTRSEARRLLEQGFTVDTVMRGLRVSVDERAERRAQLRADATIVDRRRKTVRMAMLLLATAVVLVVSALRMRTGVPGNYRTPLGGVIMVFSGVSCFGIGMVLLLRSPLKMSLAERLFRIVWLGATGRWMLNSVAPNAGVAGSRAVSMTVARRTASPVINTRDETADRKIASLEARLARLEQKINAP